MKGFYTFFICFFLTTGGSLFAQCPPPGFPNSGNTCGTAPILCENLDGYCNTINNNNVVQNFPGCPSNQLNNDEWFAFYAGSTTITIVVTPSNCSAGGMQGLQGGIYNGCGGPVMDVQCACTTNPFTLTANNYVIGQIYWMVLDGCAGNVCDYSIDVTQGSTVGQPPANPGPINGPIEVCQGTTTNYNITPPTGATIYTWTLMPAGLGTVNGTNSSPSVTWGANATGTAQLCVTVANQCYANPTPSCIDIVINPKPTAMLSGSGVLCAGNGNPPPVPLTVTFTGDAPWQFIYTINGIAQPSITTSSNPYTIMATQAGNYALQSVTSTMPSCPGTVSGTASVTLTTITLTATPTNETCGLSNGSINATPGGGGPYTYMWSSGQMTEDLSNIPAGTYTLTVTGANGCTKTVSATVSNIVTPLNVTGVVVNNTTCNGGNGSIDVSVTPPPGTYTYNWNSGQMTQDLSNLTQGTYSITVSAGGTCTGSASFTINDNPVNPNIASTVTPSSCDFSNGAINLNVTGGVSPFTYSWSNGAMTQNLTGLLAGTYVVTVTGTNGCTNTASITVNNVNPPIGISAAISSNTTCNGGNGSINVTINPAGTYTYTWSTGDMTQDLNNLAQGTYSLTVSAGGSCSNTADFTINNNPNVPVITPTVLQSTCDMMNGSINLIVNGSVAPYTYAWSNGAMTQNLTGLLAGTYDVTVTGTNGCTSTTSITVGNNNPPINITANVLPNTTCNGSFNGSIDVSVSPANNAYTYTWGNGAMTQDLNNLGSGTYSLTVSAGGSCTASADFSVVDTPNQPSLSVVTTESTCDLSNGNINLSVSGGVAPYTYIWSNSAVTQDISNLLIGGYTVTVTGANGCTSVIDGIVTNNNPPITITATVTSNTTCNGGNGSINVSVSPAAPYTYMWSNGAATQDISNLTGGSYTITVSAGGSCTETATFDVPNDPNNPDLFFAPTQATCGLSNGSINLSVSGGVSPYTYLWSNNATTQDISGLPADIYIVTVTGANGCTTIDGLVIDDVMVPITLNGADMPVTSCISNNGSIVLTLSPANMSILWSTGSMASSLSNLAVGDYSVTVSAGGTCTASASFFIYDDTAYPVLTTDITAANCNLPNGAVDLEAVGGIPPLKYKWSNGATTQDLTNKLAGTYTVTVTSATGCSTELTVDIPNNPIAIGISGVVLDNNSCTAPNGFIDLDLTPTVNYTFNWSNNLHTEDLNNVAPGMYTVTVTYGTCVETSTFEVMDVSAPPNLSVVGLPATCGLSNGGTDLSVSGGSSPYTYHWSNNASTQDLSNLAPGTYSVTVTDFFGCSATASVNVSNNNVALNISGVLIENTSCTLANGGVNISVLPAGTYNYSWSNSAVTEDIGGLSAGSFTVTVSAGLSCSSTATFAVIDNTPNPLIAPAITAAICGNSNGAIDLTISGASAPYTFAWSNSAVTEDLNNILYGNYTVTVTASNGCTADTTLNVANNSSTFSLTGLAAPLTNCVANNGAIDLTVTPSGPYTYVWSNGALTQDIANLPAGTYTVSVTETGTCTAFASYIVTDNRTYPGGNQSVTPEICGLANGAIDLTVNGGTSPYTYSWFSGQSTEDLVNVAQGTYSVTITDANGCTGTTSANLPGNAVSFSIAGIPTPNSSCVADNGNILINLTPSNPGPGLAYTFLWSNMAPTQDLNAIAPGAYTVTVSAGGTCTSTASFTVGDIAAPPSLAETISAAFCGQNSGSIDLTTSAGQAPYTYQWSTPALTEDLNMVSAGDYTVTVSGANGCSVIDNYTVPENVIIPSISGNTTPNTSCIANNGAISLNVSPVLTYTYTWLNGQMSSSLNAISPGAYTVTVSAGGGCTSSASFTIADNTAAVLVNGSTTDILCFGQNTGAIDLSASGGAPPYLYNWLPAIPGNPQDLSGLNAGNFAVTVTDSLGCTGTTAFSINQPAAALQINCSAINSVTAPGATDGSGKVNIAGGTAPYSVVWSPGSSQSPVLAGNFPINNLGVGVYQISVTDANGCTATCSFTVALINCETAVGTMQSSLLTHCGPGCITATYNSLGQYLDPNDVLQYILHEGSGNQIVNEIARSSQPKFCYDPATMAYGTTYYISVAAGDNDGTGNVNLSNFCTVVSIGTPIEFREKPVAAIVSPEPITCAVLQVGLAGSSDLPGTLFAWTTNIGQIIGNAAQANIIAGKAGAYTLIINTNGCADTALVNVLDIRNQPSATITASPDDILDCTINEIVLAGLVEGTLAANTVWTSNGLVYANGTTVQIDNPGTYQFVILDTLTFCSDTADITIDENQAYPPLFVNPPGLLTCVNDVVTLSGGSPIPGINFTWIKVNGTDTISVGSGTSVNITTPGLYYLVGVDPVNNCNNALPATVNADIALPVADAGIPFSIKCFGETRFLDGSGSSGAANLTFFWSTPDGHLVAGTTTPTPEVNEPGTYRLKVTNPGNGCSDTDEVVIAPEDPVAVASVSQPPCFGDKGAIRIDSVIGAAPPIQYSIDNGLHYSAQTLFTNLNPGTYTIQVLDANGCSTSVEATVQEGEVFDIFVEPKAIIKLGESYQINTQVNLPLSDIASVSWLPATGLSCDTCLNPVANPLHSTQYRVKVLSKAGCEDSAPLLLVVQSVDVYIPNVFSPDGDGVNDVFMIFADTRGVKEVKSFQVFSRWGEMVHEYYHFIPNNPAYGWNGKYNGAELNPAVFAWYAVIEFIDGSEVLYEGDVTLKR